MGIECPNDRRWYQMKLWTKAAIGIAAVLVLGVGANFVAMAASTDNPVGVVDISGPCDEAEHANDPRCTGAGAGAPDDDSAAGRNDDRSGHGSDNDDESGHGGDNDDESGHDDDSGSEDHSGSGDED